MNKWLCFGLVGTQLFTCHEARNHRAAYSYASDTTVIKQVDTISTQPPDTLTVKIDSSELSKTRKIEAFFEKLHRVKQFNGTVLIAQQGKVLYTGAFGYKDFRKKDPLTIETPFQLASVSKQFTAMAVMILKEQGKLSYDDTIKKYLPGFPYEGITVRHLLTHRSGLPDYTYFCEDYTDRQSAVSNEDMLNIMSKHRPKPYLLPNRRHDYSNTGYGVLASVVEAVSGESFEDFMQENIFTPLGMKHTFVYNKSKQNMRPGVALGHNARSVRVADDYLNGVVGDKGVYSTVTDMYRWDQAVYSGSLVSSDVLEEAFTPANKDMIKPFNYGFGWRIYTHMNGEKVLFHAGWWKGFKTFYLHNPKDSTAVIILSNRVNKSFSNIDELMDILYNRRPSTARKFHQKILHSPGA